MVADRDLMTIVSPTTADEMAVVIDVMSTVWESPWPLVTVEMLMAISHAGGYISIANELDEHGARRPVAASIGILARHAEAPALHSHITGVVPSVQGSGVGRAIKLHQRDWAVASGIDWIVWTFDPLVRRNAWFNISVLGVEVVEYLPSFYGTMSDAINAGDESDRLFVVWDVHRATPEIRASRPHRTWAAPFELVPTPDDIVELRRIDPDSVTMWRAATRRALTDALDAGRPVIGFTGDGEYVIGSPR